MKGEVAGVPACVVVGLRRLGVATVYEASGRRGLVDAPLERVVPGIRVAGLASTVLCGQGDNLAVHAALARVQPGEVLVLAMPEPGARGLGWRGHRGPGEGARGGWPADRRSHPGRR